MKKIAIFASGSGSNAMKIIEYFAGSSEVSVYAVYCNKPGAGIISKAEGQGIEVRVFDRETFKSDAFAVQLLQEHIDLIVLAGFLWLVPQGLTEAFERRIVNIHPALLPAYGGKGMYGVHVHEAVWNQKEKESGMTIHFVNEKYDSGDIIFQASCEITETDTPEDIQNKVLKLEHMHYAPVIESVLRSGNF